MPDKGPLVGLLLVVLSSSACTKIAETGSTLLNGPQSEYEKKKDLLANGAQLSPLELVILYSSLRGDTKPNNHVYSASNAYANADNEFERRKAKREIQQNYTERMETIRDEVSTGFGFTVEVTIGDYNFREGYFPILGANNTIHLRNIWPGNSGHGRSGSCSMGSNESRYGVATYGVRIVDDPKHFKLTMAEDDAQQFRSRIDDWSGMVAEVNVLPGDTETKRTMVQDLVPCNNGGYKYEPTGLDFGESAEYRDLRIINTELVTLCIYGKPQADSVPLGPLACSSTEIYHRKLENLKKEHNIE